MTKNLIPHSEAPASPQETLPTMYKLASDNPEEPGLPEEFHDLQPELLSRTFRCQYYRKYLLVQIEIFTMMCAILNGINARISF
ncbi:hypothetical protein [Moorena producens]|uniref:hypothetical protein n=1 Tax=Moorena producens TaxID=1155739 RepID=UPI000A8B9125